MVNPVELIEQTFLYGTANAIYVVHTQNARTAYMRVTRTNYMNDKRIVVIVDARKFLSLWRNGVGPTWNGVWHRLIDNKARFLNQNIPARDRWLPYLSADAWKKDYKFSQAEEGFLLGEGNPVPLAEIGYREYPDPSISFTNGITRTIWLLANGATAFPIECYIRGAEMIHRYAGVEWSQPKSVEQLTGHLSWTEWIESRP